MDFAEQIIDPVMKAKYSQTKVYIFTFSDAKRNCIECTEKFAEMIVWFQKYGILEDPVNNVKWIFEDEMNKNLIVNDIGISKSPTHLICDSECRIIDIVAGFPSVDWLEKHLLPMVRS